MGRAKELEKAGATMAISTVVPVKILSVYVLLSRGCRRGLDSTNRRGKGG
jgi:hypothetical protein